MQSLEALHVGTADVAVQEVQGRVNPEEFTLGEVRPVWPRRVGHTLDSKQTAEEAAVARGRRRRTWVDSVERRAERAQTLVALGEISSGRAALEGSPVAPGNQATLNSLRDESSRPRTLRDPLPDHLLNHQPEREFLLDRDRFLRNLRCSRRGAAPGPTGMTAEHLRPLLDSVHNSGL